MAKKRTKPRQPLYMLYIDRIVTIDVTVHRAGVSTAADIVALCDLGHLFRSEQLLLIQSR